MKLKDDKRCLIIKGKEGKDYREMFSKNVSFACGIAVHNALVSEWGDAWNVIACRFYEGPESILLGVSVLCVWFGCVLYY